METRIVYKCFISSPGDCEVEREVCQRLIDSINNGLAKHLKINFEVFMWEYDVLPDMGRNGQEIIDEYIENSNYDIFIGIMKNRFGQPTKKAGSGTEHEYNGALEKKETRKIHYQELFSFSVMKKLTLIILTSSNSKKLKVLNPKLAKKDFM